MANRKPQTENRKLTRLLPRVLGMVLGGIFFYAGLQKHYHPYEFAEAVLAYQLAPVWLAGAVAAVIPWVELVAGGFLVAGVKRRSCLQLLMVLTASFLVIMLVTMARGLKIDCGCGLFFQTEVGLVAMLQDTILLAWAGWLYCWEMKAVSSKQ